MPSLVEDDFFKLPFRKPSRSAPVLSENAGKTFLCGVFIKPQSNFIAVYANDGSLPVFLMSNALSCLERLCIVTDFRQIPGRLRFF